MVAPDVQPLLIFPCNGNGIEALDCLGEAYELLGFVDDAVEKRGGNVQGYPVNGREALSDCSSARVLAVPGSPSSYRSRPEIVEGLGRSLRSAERVWRGFLRRGARIIFRFVSM